MGDMTNRTKQIATGVGSKSREPETAARSSAPCASRRTAAPAARRAAGRSGRSPLEADDALIEHGEPRLESGLAHAVGVTHLVGQRATPARRALELIAQLRSARAQDRDVLLRHRAAGQRSGVHHVGRGRGAGARRSSEGRASGRRLAWATVRRGSGSSSTSRRVGRCGPAPGSRSRVLAYGAGRVKPSAAPPWSSIAIVVPRMTRSILLFGWACE